MGETLTRMESVTQGNAANAQQTASSANQMHSEVQTTRDHADQLAEVLGL
jgi:hypothetical protein